MGDDRFNVPILVLKFVPQSKSLCVDVAVCTLSVKESLDVHLCRIRCKTEDGDNE